MEEIDWSWYCNPYITWNLYITTAILYVSVVLTMDLLLFSLTFHCHWRRLEHWHHSDSQLHLVSASHWGSIPSIYFYSAMFFFSFSFVPQNVDLGLCIQLALTITICIILSQWVSKTVQAWRKHLKMASWVIFFFLGRWGLGLIPCFICTANDKEAVLALKMGEQSWSEQARFGPKLSIFPWYFHGIETQ